MFNPSYVTSRYSRRLSTELTCGVLLTVRALSNTRDSFVKVLGDVHYGNLDAAQAKKLGLGDILFNSEEDNHNPLLKVEETLDLALVSITQQLLLSLGISAETPLAAYSPSRSLTLNLDVAQTSLPIKQHAYSAPSVCHILVERLLETTTSEECQVVNASVCRWRKSCQQMPPVSPGTTPFEV